MDGAWDENINANCTNSKIPVSPLSLSLCTYSLVYGLEQERFVPRCMALQRIKLALT